VLTALGAERTRWEINQVPPFADKIDMQNRLFSELSRMFGNEVPLYDKSLTVNRVCNRAACDLLSQVHGGFSISDEQLDRTSGERHGAIRIGRPDEYRWVTRFFACFAMEPHNFYDMTNVGAKSQPIIATAFRSVVAPEHRVFTSLLMTSYFDPATRKRIEGLLSTRSIFSARAKELVERSEREGGLSAQDADGLIKEGVDRIFKWTGRARDLAFYNELGEAGFKIAADIACFESHHLNHLTPNTFLMDLFTSAMKFCMGEMDEPTFRSRAGLAFGRLLTLADADFMRLVFKHLSIAEIDGYVRTTPAPHAIAELIDFVTARLKQPDLRLAAIGHAGFKDFTEGPSADTPVLLRQDAYRALTEPVAFRNADGSEVSSTHTARFGEIEQRFYAMTPEGRALYDACLAQADAAREKDPSLLKRDFEAYERLYAAPFARFPKTLRGLIEKGLVHATYEPTSAGLAAAGTIQTADLTELLRAGHVRVEGLRYEDFLPVSAAGIFASNLNQYGTKSTAAVRPTYTRAMLEEIMGKRIVDAVAIYHAMEARSILDTHHALGTVRHLGAAQKAALESAAAALDAFSFKVGQAPAPVAAMV
jgi:uncharacterized glyoxalase superfamily metalloenzyme YdcJ